MPEPDVRQPTPIPVLPYAGPSVDPPSGSRASLAFFFGAFAGSAIPYWVALSGAPATYESSARWCCWVVIVPIVFGMFGTVVLAASTQFARWVKGDSGWTEGGDVAYGWTGVGYAASANATWWLLQRAELAADQSTFAAVLYLVPIGMVPTVAPLWLLRRAAVDSSG